MASTKISNSFHFPATAGYLLPLRLGLHCRIQHKTPWLSRSQFTCQQYFSGNSMEPGTAQFFLWGRTDTQRNPVYLQSVLGGKHSYGLRSLSKIYFKVSKPTAVYPHPLHSRVTISAGTVLPEKQHYTGTSLWADKALSLTLHITTYSSLHHYYFLSLSLVTSIFPLLSVECFFFPVFMLLLHKGKKKDQDTRKCTQMMHATILPFWHTQQFLLAGHPTIPVFYSVSLFCQCA